MKACSWSAVISVGRRWGGGERGECNIVQEIKSWVGPGKGTPTVLTHWALTLQCLCQVFSGPHLAVKQDGGVVNSMTVRLLCFKVPQLAGDYLMVDRKFLWVYFEVGELVHDLGEQDGLLVVITFHLHLSVCVCAVCVCVCMWYTCRHMCVLAGANLLNSHQLTSD